MSRADLHIHTLYSDGSDSTEQLLTTIRTNQITYFSVTTGHLIKGILCLLGKNDAECFYQVVQTEPELLHALAATITASTRPSLCASSTASARPLIRLSSACSPICVISTPLHQNSQTGIAQPVLFDAVFGLTSAVLYHIIMRNIGDDEEK